ncbi:MAG: hypothetical protein Q9169_008493 [Polycauliona sp. 2 TL-2023]
MPIKWTPERDQTLLLKILETSEITANVAKISETWPETEEAPTARAIQERLVRIRAMAGGKGTGTFKIGTQGARTSPAKSATPSKSKGGKAGNGNAKKRKSALDDTDESSKSGADDGSPTPPKSKKAKSEKKVDDNGNGIKPEPIDQMDGAVDVGFYMAAEI